MLKASADKIDYDINYDAIGNMIDGLCAMSKAVNTASRSEETGE